MMRAIIITLVLALTTTAGCISIGPGGDDPAQPDSTNDGSGGNDTTNDTGPDPGGSDNDTTPGNDTNGTS